MLRMRARWGKPAVACLWHPVNVVGLREFCEPSKGASVVSILLVEPMSLLRGALVTVLSAEGFKISEQLARVEEAASIARRLLPDIAIVGLDLASERDVAALEQLHLELPSCAIVLLLDVNAPGAIRGGLETWVRGFVGKDTAPDRLVEYVRRVVAGERVIDPALAVAAWQARPNPLSRREREVLRVAAEGRTSQEIAGELHLSVGTVRNYLSSIMRKTGARTRLEAYRIAAQAGWL
jgi:two-component system, NarL family, response regulator DesR